jgi:fructose 1,6-bisphosphate aldolase/phosphatase
MDYLRRHGPFEPHRLPIEDLEYTTMPQIEARIADRWEPIGEPVPARAPAPAGGRKHLTDTAGPPA